MIEFRSSLYLVGFLIIVGIFSRWNEEKVDSDSEKSKILVDVLVEDLREFSIYTQKKVRFRKNKFDFWEVSVDERSLSRFAKSGMVDDLVARIINLSYHRKIAGGSKKISDFGFDDGIDKITFRFPEKSLQMLIGNRAPVGFHRYLMTSESEDIFLVSQSIDLIMNPNIESLLSRSFLTPRVISSKRIVIKDSEGSTKETFLRSDSGWKSKKGTDISSFIKSIANVQIRNLADAEQEKFVPLGFMEFWSENEELDLSERIEFYSTRSQEGLWIKSSSEKGIYKMPAGITLPFDELRG